MNPRSNELHHSIRVGHQGLNLAERFAAEREVGHLNSSLKTDAIRRREIALDFSINHGRLREGEQVQPTLRLGPDCRAQAIQINGAVDAPIEVRGSLVHAVFSFKAPGGERDDEVGQVPAEIRIGEAGRHLERLNALVSPALRQFKLALKVKRRLHFGEPIGWPVCPGRDCERGLTLQRGGAFQEPRASGCMRASGSADAARFGST